MSFPQVPWILGSKELGYNGLGAAVNTYSNAGRVPVTSDYGREEQAMRAYLTEGERRAYALNNRGPVRYTDDGAIHPDILSAYWKHGFYVFEGVLRQDELDELRADVDDMMSRLPTHPGSDVDAAGRPALAHNCKAPTLFWSKPLGDPFGGYRTRQRSPSGQDA